MMNCAAATVAAAIVAVMGAQINEQINEEARSWTNVPRSPGINPSPDSRQFLASERR
jgi:hypothetical protein